MRVHARSSNGFTLLDLLISVMIAGLVLGFGLPGIQSMAYNSKRLSSHQSLHASLYAARNEAIVRSGFVTVCKRNSSATDCDTATDWNDGWIIFVDKNGDYTVDADDTVLRVFDGIGSDIQVTGNSKVRHRVRFDMLGRTGNNGTITICDPRGSNYARAVVISNTGKIRSSSSGLTC